MSIQNWIKKHYPVHFKTGLWGCCVIDFEGGDSKTENQLCQQFPHGFKVELNKRKYWVWLDHDYYGVWSNHD